MTMARAIEHAPPEVGLAPVSRWQAVRRALVVFGVLFGALVLALADRVGLRWLGFVLAGRRADYTPLTGPVLARRAFERLGPTYVKLGQLVASGEALFPARYSEAFRTLLDRVPAFSFEEAACVLDEELGDRADALVSIDPEPLAAASIAQVHAASLEDGTPVVVKVQRPGIAALAATDIALMRGAARLLMRVSVHARRANALAVIEDFEANLREELDFGNEAARMREFNEVMDAMGTDSVAAPIVYDRLSGARVLTMERFDGWRLDDTEGVTGSGFDPKERLLTGIRAWFQTLIVRGFFHGDVHAGNFMLLEDGRIGYLDFGIVGRFSAAQRQNVLEYVLGFQSRDFARVARAMVGMGTMTDADGVDLETFSSDLAEAYAPMMDPVEGFQMKDLVPQLLRVSRKHELRMPRDLVLVTKQLVYLDRYSRAYGGAKMNVLTDNQLKNYIMQDMLAAMMAG